MGKRTKVNWEDARLEYITSEISQRELAEKFGASPSAVANRCLKENWVREREKYKRKINAEITKKLAAKKARKLIHLSGAADNLAKIASKKSRAILNAAQNAEKTGDKCAWLTVNAKEVLELAKATETLTAVIRDLHGIPAEQTEEKVLEVHFTGEEDFTV